MYRISAARQFSVYQSKCVQVQRETKQEKVCISLLIYTAVMICTQRIITSSAVPFSSTEHFGLHQHIVLVFQTVAALFWFALINLFSKKASW